MNFEVLPKSSLNKKYVGRPPDSTSMALYSIAIMHDATFQLIWIENGQNITRNNCLQVSKLPSWRLLIILKICCFHLFRTSASSFSSQYLLLFFKSSSNCVLLLLLLPNPITSVICNSMASWRRQFLLRLWPIQLAFLCRVLL